jgi:hypothetical protein
MINHTCDVCKNPIEDTPQKSFLLKHGAQILDIRVGVHKSYEGDTCVPCTKKLLSLVAKHGIFVGNKITLPETIKPEIEEITKAYTHTLFVN